MGTVTNAQGSTSMTEATFSNSAASASGTLELSSFAAQAAVPAGATINSVTYRVRSSIMVGSFQTPSSMVATMNAELRSGATVKATNSIKPAANVMGQENEFTVSGVTYAELADLRIRFVMANNGSAGISRAYGVDWGRVTVDYTATSGVSTTAFLPFF